MAKLKKSIKYDSMTWDCEGKILVIAINGKVITDPQEIAKLMEPSAKEKKDDER